MSDFPWREPDRGQGAIVEQDTQALGVELVGLIDVAHHDLGLVGVSHEGQAGSLFDLVDDPVPVAHALECDGCAFGELREEVAYGAPLMVDPGAPDDLTFGIEHSEEGEQLVGVATDLIMRYVTPPAKTGGDWATTWCSGRCSAFIRS